MYLRVSKHIGPVACAAFVVLAFNFGEANGATRQKTRVIQRSPAEPIEKRLQPDDEVVVIRDLPLVTGLEDEPVSVPREIAWLAATSDVALVVEVLDQKGRLVDSGRWINSTITVRVEIAAMERPAGSRKVLEQSSLEGQRIDIQWIHGGEVNIGKVQVRARPTQLDSGGKYLLFIDRVGGEWHLGTRFAVQKDGKLRHLFEPDDSRKYVGSVLDGLPLESVLRDLRRVERVD